MGIVLLGAPGAGKGTQAATLARRIGAAHISTGDLFRAHVADRTELGRAAQRCLDEGSYVPDEITNAMVRDQIRATAADGTFILDGYPRTIGQIGYLDRLLADLGLPTVDVVALTVQADELIRRLVHRFRAGGRSDDTEAVIRERQAVYLAQTAPLLTVYRDRGVLREVDGAGQLTDVARRIDEALAGLTGAGTCAPLPGGTARSAGPSAHACSP
ncbi:adenylate kinase [Micromonosporaceae bacterium Da 78-11]